MVSPSPRSNIIIAAQVKNRRHDLQNLDVISKVSNNSLKLHNYTFCGKQTNHKAIHKESVELIERRIQYVI